MEKTARIFVAGARGLAGSAIVRALRAAGFQNLLLPTSRELDLTEGTQVKAFFENERPDYVFEAAAKVGGIIANDTLPAEFIHVNLAIQANVIHESWRTNVKRLLFLGSNCIYPRDCPQPIKEEYLLTGPLEPTNRPYAIAKIAGLEMCWAYNRQYGTRFCAPMPTNMYGPGDNYHPQHSHVISAFIRKFWEAKKSGARTVTAWGSGKPKREFIHADDTAAACVHLMNLTDAPWDELFPLTRAPIVNLGSGQEWTIAELAETVRQALGASATVKWDRSKPDGTPRKVCDCSRILATGWRPRIKLEDGIRTLIPELETRL